MAKKGHACGEGYLVKILATECSADGRYSRGGVGNGQQRWGSVSQQLRGDD